MPTSLGAWRWSTWSPTTLPGRAPSPRAGYASTIFDSTFYVVGGWNGKDAFHDAFALGVSEEDSATYFRWRELSVRSEGDATLKGRILFAHAAIDSIIYIHGGTSVANLAEVHSDVLAFDTRSSSLRRLVTNGGGPGPLNRHAIAARAGELWVVGGNIGAGKGDAKTSDVYRLDVGDGGGAPAQWHKVATTGFAPWPRSHNCLLTMPEPSPYLLLVGGGDGGRDFDDLYTLDLSSRYWERVTNTSGEAWALSNSACALLPLGGGSDEVALLMHGGYGGLGTGNHSEHGRQHAVRVLPLAREHAGAAAGAAAGASAWRWAELRASGTRPVARMSHNLHVINASCMLTFGGNADDGHKNDLSIGRPNRLGRPGALEAEADVRAAAAAEAEAMDEATKASSDAWYADDDDDDDEVVEEVEAAVRPVEEEAAAAAAAAAAVSAGGENGDDDDEEEEEAVVVRTVRVADKRKKARGKAKKRRRKDEL